VILPFSPSLQRLAVNLQGAGASAATGPPSCASSLEGGPYPGWQIRPTASPLGALASSAWPTLSTALLEDFPRPTCARSRRSVLLRPSTLQDGIDHCLHLPTKGPSCKILVGAERNNRVSHFPVGEVPRLTDTREIVSRSDRFQPRPAGSKGSMVWSRSLSPRLSSDVVVLQDQERHIDRLKSRIGLVSSSVVVTNTPRIPDISAPVRIRRAILFAETANPPKQSPVPS
jgi:hypothetical protein